MGSVNKRITGQASSGIKEDTISKKITKASFLPRHQK
jgi:hypothetical protein